MQNAVMNRPELAVDQYTAATSPIRKLNLKAKAMDEDFTSTVQDVEICVKGDYEPIDRSVGIESTSYTVTHVWLPLDMQQQNIIDLLTPAVINRLSDEGNEAVSNRKAEESCQA